MTSTRVVLSLGFLFAAGISAQPSRRPVTVGLGGGATMPMSDFADDVKSGFHGNAFLQYEPARNIWGVRGEVLYSRGDLTDAARGDLGVPPDDKLNSGVLYLGGTAVLLGRNRERSLTPYLLGGLGLYRLTISRGGTISTSATESGFGFNGGAGVRLGKAGLYAEVRFHQFAITADDVKSTYQMIPASIGIRF
jgi:opacity protein-like surface antigen